MQIQNRKGDDLTTFLESVNMRFDRRSPLCVARAPGRLDVMGGIADYSGSLVLQRTIAEATFAAVQPIDAAILEVVSSNAFPGGPERVYRTDWRSFAPGGRLLSYEETRRMFQATDEHWAAYVVGAFIVLSRERGTAFSRGSKILISSQVPEGKGVASSAALEVAVMQAVARAFEIKLEPVEMAKLCQKVENLVAGAPCGIMDQMTSVCGLADSLLALLCQPAELQSSVLVPEELAFWGIDSGERHAVSGADYGAVRTGAFMAHRMISEWAGNEWNGYLANIAPSEFEREYLKRLPDHMTGSEFLGRYSDTADTVTKVDSGRVYRIRQPAAHPVFEHHRVKAYRQLLAGPSSEEQRRLLGELMYQSHESYSACGLGSHGTDLIVSLVRAERDNGLYGARITGGGSGGTVVVLGQADAGQRIAQVADRYREITGYHPYVFAGSSDGAQKFGALSL